MATFKCKMCAGTLKITDNQTVCECEFCGSVQTVSVIDDQKIIKLYERANRLRRANEFDKAMSVYESIIDESDTEAEAYWGMVLCEYGIEYVDDPYTGKKIPTCHRSSFDSIMDDEDFELVMENADPRSREVYRAEAKRIEEIRRGIVEVSGKEAPYDIFICYKETDENGDRTIDSVLAQDVYDALIAKDYRVFFSRISLEDRLGTEYEPYIFAALNSAKVMLAFGTNYEYYNSVWVKNEWSRYLKIMARDKGKYLIPCYKGIDAYDIPKEFARLQAQDMGKVGAIQDLLRGIEKLIGKRENIESTPALQQVVLNAEGTDVDALMQRVFIFLEDEDWIRANEYCERVLDIDPDNAEAYLGKLMSEIRASKKEFLKNQEKDFADNKNYKKAYRFGDGAMKDLLDIAIKTIIYNDAMRRMEKSDTEDAYKEAASVFESILGFKDSASKVKECYEKAESARKDGIYNEAIKHKKLNTIAAQEEAIMLLLQITDWKDAQNQILSSQTKISKIKDDTLDRGIMFQKEDTIGSHKRAINEFESIPGWKNADELAAYSRERISKIAEESEEHYRQRLEKIRESNKKRAKGKRIAFGVFALILLLYFVGVKILIPAISHRMNYYEAMSLKDAGNYEKAIEKFTDSDGYGDAYGQIQECKERIKENKYSEALDYIRTGDYVAAGKLLVELGDYKDSKDQLRQIGTQIDKQNLREGNVGENIEFGNYKCLLLAKENNKALIITAESVGYIPYNTEYIPITWEKCTLRKWLNGEFYNTFSDEEKQTIVNTHLRNNDNAEYQTDGGNDTDDKIFLLSVDEVNRYWHLSYSYARIMDRKLCLRTPGYNNKYVACVEQNGLIDEVGEGISTLYAYSICPAMWIDIE